MKKIFTLLAGILLSFHLWAQPAAMGDGTGLAWELTDGTLTITYDGIGTGNMPDYKASGDRAPWYDSRRDITSIVLPAGLKTIGNQAFRGCSSFQSISIPASVTSIGNSAFNGCSSLKSVTINATTPPSLGDLVFNYCHDNLKIYVPDAQAQLYANAWLDLEGKLYQITSRKPAPAPHGEGSCGTNLTWDYTGGVLTFSGSGEMADYTSETQPWAEFATHITSIVLPEGLTHIGAYAFDGCSNLISVEIPENVTSIGDSAFVDATSLASLTCAAATPPTLGDDVFLRVLTSTCTLYVPEGKITAYREADEQWNDFTNILPIDDGDQTALDETNANAKAVKSFREGQLLIEKNGKTYNALGTEVK